MKMGCFSTKWGLKFLQAVDRIVGGRCHPTSLVHVLTNNPAFNSSHNLLLLFDLLLSLTDVATVGLGLEQGKQIDSGDGQFLFLSPRLANPAI